MTDDQTATPTEVTTEPSAGPAVIDAPSDAPLEAFVPPEAELPSEAALPSYDFAQSSRMGGTQLRALTAMHDVLAEGLTAWLTAKLRESIRVELLSVEERTY